MRIIFVASVVRHITSFHLPYIKFFQQKGGEVWVAANGNSAEWEYIEKLGINYINVNFSRSPLSKSNIDAFKQLRSFFNQQDFDLVHVHTPVAAFLTRLAFRNKKKGKILYTAHGFHFFKGAPKKNWLIFYNAEKLARKWTDGIIVMNSEDYQNALKLGYRKEEVFFVHGVGVDIPNTPECKRDRDKLKNELAINSESVIISIIAELNDNKNHEFLLRNWKEITKNCPEAVLLIIGNGENETKLKKYVKNENLSNIHFLGYRTDVIEILNETDIVTLLSKREGLPRSIMEAMAQKVPCIVTNTRGLRDLVNNNENGYVIDHNDDKNLKKAFITLIKDKEKRINMGERSYELVQSYDINKVIKEYENVYKEYI